MKDNNNKKEVAKVILVLAVIIVACICGQLFVGCSPRITPPAEIRDSVRVEIRERVVHDTAYVDVPLIKEVNVLTKWQGFQIILGRILGGLFLLIILMLAVRAFLIRK